MRKQLLLAIGFFVLAQCVVAGAGQSTEAKPDTPVPAAAADPRLKQKVTYEGGYKRLHQVTDDLSKQTGVTIYCGKKDGDWPVRDLPLVVCVRDMPLGKLLRLLALTTHTQYVSKKTSSQAESERTYRIYRTAEQEKEISSLLQKRRDAKLALADWSWDALVKLGSSPDSVGGPEDSKLIGKILASLGPQAKKKVFDGEEVSVRGKDCPQADLIQELYRLQWASMKEGMGEEAQTAPEPSQTDTEGAVLDMYVMDLAGEEDRTGVGFNLSPVVWGRVETGWTGQMHYLASDLRSIEELDLPPQPEEDGPPLSRDEMTDKSLQFLNVNHDGDWSRTSLHVNVKLDMPEGKKEATFADLIVALSKRGGFDVVCEDFVSQNRSNPGNMSSYFGPKVDAGATLRRVALATTSWFINDEQKLLVGWAADWRDHHSHLVSADYLAGLRKEMDREGLDIDDVTPFANMTWGQFCEWIFESRDLSMLSQARLASAWKLYDLLNTADKARAKSESGLLLGTFDPQALAAYCREQRMQKTTFFIRGPSDSTEPVETEQQRTDRVLSDPKLVATLVMRVKSQPITTRPAMTVVNGREQWSGELTPAALKLQTYHMELEGMEDGRPFNIDVSGQGLAFPVYSPKREAEILKEKTGEEDTKANGTGDAK